MSKQDEIRVTYRVQVWKYMGGASRWPDEAAWMGWDNIATVYESEEEACDRAVDIHEATGEPTRAVRFIETTQVMEQCGEASPEIKIPK